MTQAICIALTPQIWACPPDKTLAVMENAIEAQFQNIVRAVTVMAERIQRRTTTPATIVTETFDSLEKNILRIGMTAPSVWIWKSFLSLPIKLREKLCWTTCLIF